MVYSGVLLSQTCIGTSKKFETVRLWDSAGGVTPWKICYSKVL